MLATIYQSMNEEKKQIVSASGSVDNSLLQGQDFVNHLKSLRETSNKWQPSIDGCVQDVKQRLTSHVVKNGSKKVVPNPFLLKKSDYPMLECLENEGVTIDNFEQLLSQLSPLKYEKYEESEPHLVCDQECESWGVCPIDRKTHDCRKSFCAMNNRCPRFLKLILIGWHIHLP
jgi:hypothetical protein